MGFTSLATYNILHRVHTARTASSSSVRDRLNAILPENRTSNGLWGNCSLLCCRDMLQDFTPVPPQPASHFLFKEPNATTFSATYIWDSVSDGEAILLGVTKGKQSVVCLFHTNDSCTLTDTNLDTGGGLGIPRTLLQFSAIFRKCCTPSCVLVPFAVNVQL